MNRYGVDQIEPSVSVVVPTRNEVARLPALLDAIEAQTWAPIEVIIVDGMSTDGSRGWLADAAISRPWMTVVDNRDRNIPAALNTGLRRARGDLVARMDTHADYAPDYIEALVRVLQRRVEVVGAGGAMDTCGRGRWGQAIAAVLRRPVGMGGAPHRVGADEGPVDHVFTGCYRRAALLQVGGFDERLLANEDFEVDTRLRKAGGTVWLVPQARSVWYVPESLPALARKMFRYGQFKAVTLRMHPDSIKARQLAPPSLLLGLLGLAFVRPRWGVTATGVYLGAAAAAGARAAAVDTASSWRAAVVPPVVHLCWGAGLLAGLARAPA